jgi:hypothetical protein
MRTFQPCGREEKKGDRPQWRERGAALILAILMVSFLAIVGGGLLMSVTLDAHVSLNYRRAARLLYLAEAGIEEGREKLRTSNLTPSALLSAAAGPDGVLELSGDLDALLRSDDVPVLHGNGAEGERYDVFLRNDAVDGLAHTVDTNDVLTLISVASNLSSRRTIEVALQRRRLPRLEAALTLDGTPVSFAPAPFPSAISGMDSSGLGGHAHAIGVTNAGDLDIARLAIPNGTESQYPGNASWSPPPADIAVVDSALDGWLKTPRGLERLARGVESMATDIVDPAPTQPAMVGPVGGPGDLRVVVVNGDCALGDGDGFGVLLVRGTLTLAGNFRWNGLILVIGQGDVRSTGGVGEIYGGLLVARTRDTDRTAALPLGTILGTRGAVSADFSHMSALRIAIDRSIENALAASSPYSPVAIRER